MTSSFDAIVIGLGGMGAAALRHLAKRGKRVLGIEQHDVAHALGSSHGGSRVIRKAYFEHPSYVPLLLRSYELWRELERDIGAPLLHLTGCLNVGPRDGLIVRGVLDSVRAHDLVHEVLDARELVARFPAFAVPADFAGVYEADGGILAPERCTRAHVDAAARDGAEVRTRACVRDLDARAGRVRVTLDDGAVVEASACVLALGPWAPSTPWVAPFVPAARMRAQRQVQCWFAPTSATFARGALPVFIVERADGSAYYGLPPFDGAGVKVARHGGGATTTPAAVDRTVAPADVDDVRTFLRAHLPALDAPSIDASVCMYTVTPDEHFVVGRRDSVVVLGGFSGHGYKMASVMGEIAADLVEGHTRHDIALFDPARF